MLQKSINTVSETRAWLWSCYVCPAAALSNSSVSQIELSLNMQYPDKEWLLHWLSNNGHTTDSKLDTFSIDTNLLDQGILDSFSLVLLVAEIHTTFGIELPLDSFVDPSSFTIRQILASIVDQSEE